MSYFRTGFSTFAEFQREGLQGGERLGREELEMLRQLEDEDDCHRRRRLDDEYAPWE